MHSIAVLVLSSTIWVSGQVSGQQGKKAPQVGPPAPAWLQALPAQKGKNPELSDAERVARLQDALAKDEAFLHELKSRLDDPSSEYNQAENQFKTLDADRSALRKKIQLLKSQGKTEEADRLGATSEFLEGQWQAARERFNLALQERAIFRDQATNLQQQVDRRKQALRRLTRSDSGPTAETSSSVEKPATTGSEPRTGKKPATEAGPSASVRPDGAAKNLEGQPRESTGDSAPLVARPTSTRLAHVQEELRIKEQAAAEAKRRVDQVGEWLDRMRKGLELEKKSIEAAGKRADQIQQEQKVLKKEHARRVADDCADADELDKLAQRITEGDQRIAKARSEQAAGAERLQEAQEHVALAEGKHAVALKELEEKQAVVEEAQRLVARLEDPWSLPNLVQWGRDHGPKLILILLGMFVLKRLARMGSRRLVQFIAHHGNRNTAEENESRAQTLVSVFHNAVSLGILGGGVLMLLDALCVPIMPLLGGAAVVGLAVAFGAQNLIRDYFSGFMVLMEDQYGINDVVKIGAVTGAVERITLRVTVLRDLSGIVHFIPHGTITTVSNLTHGWSRKVFDITVAPGENVNRVMDILVGIGRELRQDPAFAPFILDGPDMLGVDNLGDQAIVIRFIIKTRPLKQWLVKREMLRRIKQRFDELGIESPFSQVVTQRPAKPADRAAA